MQILKNKNAAISIAIFLIISMGASMLLMPNATAHTPPYQITTYAKTTVLPNPIGVGQSALGYAFLGNAPMPSADYFNTYRRHNYTVIITAPNGNVTTLHWDTVIDTTGAQFFRFTPDQVGQYNITFNYGGQINNQTYFDTATAAEVGDIYLPSTANCTLTVQQEAIPSAPNSYPLPTEYWTRPIYGENTDWWAISSDWFGNGSPVISSLSSGTISGIPSGGSYLQRYPGDAVGPQTSHVVWTKPIEEGGVVGGNRFLVQGDTYMEGSAYNNRFQNPIIVYGRLFYREPVSYSASSGDSVCVDLRTGQELWRKDSTEMPTISFAYVYDVQSINQHGVYPTFLVTSNWGRVFDMWTGVNVFNVSTVPGGTVMLGPQGEQLRYNFVNNGTTAAPDWYLTEWNSSRMFTGTGFASGTGLSPAADTQTLTSYAWVNSTRTYENNVPIIYSQNVSTTFAQVNASRGLRYDWINSTTQNQTLPWRNSLPSSFSFTVITAHYGDIIICRNGSYTSFSSISGQTQNVSGVVSLTSANWTYFAINLNPLKGTVGSILWWSPTYSQVQDRTITYGGADPVARVFTEACKETQNIVGYSFENGSKLWETNVVNDVQQQDITPLDYFGNPYYPYFATQPAYGKIYSLQYGGYLYCYDLTTGKRLWTFGNGNTADNSTESGLSMPGPYPGFIMAIGNDVVYMVSTQHTIVTPIPKGNMVRGVNATDGKQIWALNSYVGTFSSTAFAIADGYATWFNGYDDQIYTTGRGPSTMTVSAPNIAAASGQPVVIAGSVLDISTGSKQTEQAARFPNGIPLASDAVMTDWMGYVYQQKPLPTNFEGVNIDINVVDANGNFRTIGTPTTDAKGQYNLIWTPDIPGTYQVVATFAGTNGYWPSSATTAFNVMEPAPTPAPTAVPLQSVADMYFVPAVAGIVVAIIIVGAVLALLMLRKRA